MITRGILISAQKAQGNPSCQASDAMHKYCEIRPSWLNNLLRSKYKGVHTRWDKWPSLQRSQYMDYYRNAQCYSRTKAPLRFLSDSLSAVCDFSTIYTNACRLRRILALLYNINCYLTCWMNHSIHSETLLNNLWVKQWRRFVKSNVAFLPRAEQVAKKKFSIWHFLG